MAIKNEITKYKVFNNKQVNKRIVILADIHYFQKSEIKTLSKISRDVDKLKPDYICIPGDLLDESFVLDEEDFIKWLMDLSGKYKIFIALGNHDMMCYCHKNKTINYKLLNKINRIKNVRILADDSFVIDNIRFIGLTLPWEYYYKYNEDGNYLMNYLNEKNYHFNSDKYNILLCHSPIVLLDRYHDIVLLKDIDLSLYGHMHGGLMPSLFRKIFKDRGLINPKTTLFPKYCYGYIKDKKVIISTGITKLSHGNPFYSFRFLYRSEIVVVDLLDNKNK